MSTAIAVDECTFLLHYDTSGLLEIVSLIAIVSSFEMANAVHLTQWLLQAITLVQEIG